MKIAVREGKEKTCCCCSEFANSCFQVEVLRGGDAVQPERSHCKGKVLPRRSKDLLDEIGASGGWVHENACSRKKKYWEQKVMLLCAYVPVC